MSGIRIVSAPISLLSHWITKYSPFYTVDRFSPASFSRLPSSWHWRKQTSNATTPELLEIVHSLSPISALMLPLWRWAHRYRLDLFISFIPYFRRQVEGYKDISRCYKASGFTCMSWNIFARNILKLLCSGELTAYNTHDAAENPSKVNCGKVLTKVSQSCLQASPFHAWTGFIDWL